MYQAGGLKESQKVTPEPTQYLCPLETFSLQKFSQMRASQYSRFGDSSVLETVQLPAPVRSKGEVLLDNKAARYIPKHGIKGHSVPARRTFKCAIAVSCWLCVQYYPTRLPSEKWRILQLPAAISQGEQLTSYKGTACCSASAVTMCLHMQTPGCDFAGVVLEADQDSKVDDLELRLLQLTRYHGSCSML